MRALGLVLLALWLATPGANATTNMVSAAATTERDINQSSIN